MKQTFYLQNRKMCELCSGCESDSDFDYCRACGYTVLQMQTGDTSATDDDLDVLRNAWDALSLSRFGNEDWVTQMKNEIAMRIAKELQKGKP